MPEVEGPRRGPRGALSGFKEGSKETAAQGADSNKEGESKPDEGTKTGR